MWVLKFREGEGLNSVYNYCKTISKAHWQREILIVTTVRVSDLRLYFTECNTLFVI
jgi:hypothetical protein